MGRSKKLVIAQRPDGQKGLSVTEPVEKKEILIEYTSRIHSEPTRTSMQIDDDKHIEGVEVTNPFLKHCQRGRIPEVCAGLSLVTPRLST